MKYKFDFSVLKFGFRDIAFYSKSRGKRSKKRKDDDSDKGCLKKCKMEKSEEKLGMRMQK